MAGVKISNLPAIATPAASDVFPVVQGGVTYKESITQLGTLLLLLSGGTMSGQINMGSQRIVSMADPSGLQDAATKNYVDTVAAGLSVQPSCSLATTAALTVTYVNGSSGVGATLTNAGAMAALSIDGVAAVVGDRILVKNQASTFQNGIYTVTNIGSGASNWVLTRATDYDTVTEITPGDFVLVLSGTANAQTQWVQTATVATIGTDPIVFDQFGGDISVIIQNIQNEAYVYSADTGAADAYVATLSPVPTAYTAGMLVVLKVTNSNTGASTINVNSLGVKNIKMLDGSDPLASNLRAGQIACLVYDGTNFQLINPNYGTGASTGTGQVVRATSPNLFLVVDPNGNEVFRFNYVATAVNYVGTQNVVTTGSPIIEALGDDTNIILVIRGKGTGGVEVEGTATNDNASAGYIGELVSSIVLIGSAVALSNAVAANITSITLSAGDWDIWGSGLTDNSGVATSVWLCGISTTSATLPDPAYTYGIGGGATAGTRAGSAVPCYRVSITSNTTYYLVGYASFGGGTQVGFGTLFARRRR